MECRVYNSPKTVAEETIGDFLLNLNDWGEIEISTKYEPTTFVIEDKQTKEFIDKINILQNKKGIKKMETKEETKTRRFWKVDCLMCETHVCLDIGDYSIISTDQGAGFIRKPNFICGKCRSVCTVELVEVEVKPPIPS